MAIDIQGDIMTVRSRYAIAAWLLNGVFLVVFPPLIWAMWTTQNAKIPGVVTAIFAGLYLTCMPYLIKGITREAIVTGTLDRGRRRIEVTAWKLFGRHRTAHDFADIDGVEMRTSENDGEFHSVYLVFQGGDEFAFLHGNDRASVEEARDDFMNFIRPVCPDVKAVEKFVE